MRFQPESGASVESTSGNSIRTRPQAECHVCGGQGEIAYTGLGDHLFNAPGEWTLRRCHDRDCGLLWLDPMPVEEDLPRLYESYYTHAGGREGGGGRGHFREALKQAYWHRLYGYPAPPSRRLVPVAALLRLLPGIPEGLAQQVFDLPARPGGRLLEIGCGNGETLERMRALGWTCEGIDFDPEAVKAARRRGLDVRLGSVEQQGYASDTFDAVVMNHVIEHVPDPRRLIQECRRILKQGGHFVCITPNCASWCSSIFKDNWRGLEPPRHLHVFSARALRRLLKETDWGSMKVGAMIANSGWFAWASRKIQQSMWRDIDKRPSRWSMLGIQLFKIAAAARKQVQADTGDEVLAHTIK